MPLAGLWVKASSPPWAHLLLLALLLHGGGLCVLLDVRDSLSLHFELLGSCQLGLLRQVFDLERGRGVRGGGPVVSSQSCSGAGTHGPAGPRGGTRQLGPTAAPVAEPLLLTFASPKTM